MDLNILISKIRKYSFSLFWFPTLAILGSLTFSNILESHTFPYSPNLAKVENKIIQCNEQNNFCADKKKLNIIPIKKLGDCSKFTFKKRYYLDNVLFEGGEVYEEDFLVRTPKSGLFLFPENSYSYKFKNKDSSQNPDFTFGVDRINTLNTICIKSHPTKYKIYKFIPFYFEALSTIKYKTNYIGASSGLINPFFYGETSISNVVKRVPINFFFKTLMYISVIFMFLYWTTYKNIFNKLDEKPKLNFFFIFGLTSCFCLFFHVLFLGSEWENEIFQKLRRLIIILFILSELTAQFFLAKKLYQSMKMIAYYTNKVIVYIKIIFVSIIIFISLIIIVSLLFTDFPSNIDNILEWNYFEILLIFYFLSAIMWKKYKA